MAKRAIRERNSGTMSEAEFWSFIRSSLRRRTIAWKPIKECLVRARRPNTGPNKRLKWEVKCSVCEDHFPQDQIEVDHIIPAGSLKSADDLATFVNNLFCEVDGLRCLCKNCHQKITTETRLLNKG